MGQKIRDLAHTGERGSMAAPLHSRKIPPTASKNAPLAAFRRGILEVVNNSD
jgi:hypothetical protein